MEQRKIELERMFNELRNSGVIKSQRDLANQMGISENGLSLALSGNPKYCTPSILSRVTSFYLDNTNQNVIDGTRIPLFPMDAHGGGLTTRPEGCTEWDCEKITSPVKGAQFAIRVTGDSMAPEYPNGSVVLIRQINEEAFIEWGKVYVLDTDNGVVIKELRPCQDENLVSCHSINPHPKFAPYTIDRKYIKGWYQVLMQMSLK